MGLVGEIINLMRLFILQKTKITLCKYIYAFTLIGERMIPELLSVIVFPPPSQEYSVLSRKMVLN